MSLTKNFLPIMLAFVASCDVPGTGSSSTYSSCRITSSSALFASDRAKDLRQCWNAPGNGYRDKEKARQWCASVASAYMSRNYIFGHSYVYAVSSDKC